MTVKIGNTWYDARDQPICINLNINERKAISDLGPDSKGLYCVYPITWEEEKILKWMNT